MKKVVPGFETILAHGLTYEQAANLVDQMKARKDFMLKDRAFWISNHRETSTWYVYVVDEEIKKAFMDDPKSFVFEIP